MSQLVELQPDDARLIYEALQALQAAQSDPPMKLKLLVSRFRSIASYGPPAKERQT